MSITGGLRRPGVYTVTGHDLICSANNPALPCRCHFNLILQERHSDLITSADTSITRYTLWIREELASGKIKMQHVCVCRHASVEILMLRARGRFRFACLFHRQVETHNLFRILLFPRNAHSVAQFLNVTVPFRPDSNILVLFYVGVCDAVIPASGVELFQSTVWFWSRVLGEKLPGLRVKSSAAGAGNVHADLMWKTLA